MLGFNGPSLSNNQDGVENAIAFAESEEEKLDDEAESVDQQMGIAFEEETGKESEEEEESEEEKADDSEEEESEEEKADLSQATISGRVKLANSAELQYYLIITKLFELGLLDLDNWLQQRKLDENMAQGSLQLRQILSHATSVKPSRIDHADFYKNGLSTDFKNKTSYPNLNRKNIIKYEKQLPKLQVILDTARKQFIDHFKNKKVNFVIKNDEGETYLDFNENNFDIPQYKVVNPNRVLGNDTEYIESGKPLPRHMEINIENVVAIKLANNIDIKKYNQGDTIQTLIYNGKVVEVDIENHQLIIETIKSCEVIGI